VLTNLTDYANIFAYLGGFGIGTLLGMEVENRISIGYVIVRLITPADPQPMITRLANLGYGMTRIEGKGVTQNPVSIVFMIVPRTELPRLLGIISREYPDILYTIEDVRNIKDGARIFYKDPKRRILSFFGM
jgi:uncharacterized protein YebE (UPF0316 family)